MTNDCSKWALLIGVDQYHESLGALKYAGADCRALREALISGRMGFPEDQVLLLSDAQDAEHRPTFANIHSHLGSWLAAPKEDDLVFVFFAGHGRLVDNKTYLVPGDATLSSIHTLGIPLRNVQEMLERCKAKRKLLVLDACHSGSGRDVAAMPGGMAEALALGTGFYTIASCGSEERSHEWDEKGHGVFSHFLAEALSGACAPAADGRLTVDRVYEWVHDRVAKWAAKHRCAQTPQRFAQGAGTLVLAQTAPDHAAMAEQYRREADELQKRLSEMESAQQKTIQSTKASHLEKKTSKRKARCKVPEWKVPINEFNAFDIFAILSFGLISLLGVLFIGGLVVQQKSLNSWPLTLIIIAVCLLPFYLWFRIHTAHNRYRLMSANLCLEAGDYAGGSSFAFAIGKLGVDDSTVGALIVSLAEQAEEDQDVVHAMQLYRYARDKWKSPYATSRLAKLLNNPPP